MGTAGDEVHDAFGVIGVGVAELHEVFIGDGVHDPQARSGRLLGDADDALDGAAAGFGEGAHGFFFDGGEAAGEVTWGDGILADVLAVADGLVVGGDDLLAGGGRGARDSDDLLQADHFDDFLEDGGAPRIHEAIKECADDRIAGEARGAVGAAAFTADDEIGERHGGAWGCRGRVVRGKRGR